MRPAAPGTSVVVRRRGRRRTPRKRMDLKISWNVAHVLWFAGLRGAIAYACVRDFPNVYGHNEEFVAASNRNNVELHEGDRVEILAPMQGG